MSGDVPLAGYQFGFAYDAIGNRRSTTVNGRYASYTVNALNQTTARDVPPTVDVLGSTAADAVVTVTGPQGAKVATRQGTNFAAEVPVADNTAAPRHPYITVEAKRVTGSGTPGTVTKSSQTGRVFVARQPEAFTHDFDGNQTTDGRWTRIWDAENRLIAEETTAAAVAAGVRRTRLEHAYDGQSRRIRTVVKTGPSLATVTTRRFIYGIGWNLLVELNASTTVQRRCLWGLDLSGSLEGAGGIGGLLVETIAGVDYLPCYDGNGNITALIKATDGTEAARYTYGPFGELLRMTGAMAKANPFRFSTKYCDEETGLLYYGYRYYQSTMGRWINRDPIGVEGGLNVNAFLENKSTALIDSLGKQPAEKDAVVHLVRGPDTKPGPPVKIAGSAYDYTPLHRTKYLGPNGVGFTAIKDTAIKEYEKETGKLCCRKINALVFDASTIEDATRMLGYEADMHFLIAHGGPAYNDSMQTGLLFASSVPGYGLSYPLSAVVPGKVDTGAVNVATCYDTALPQSANGVKLFRLTDDNEYRPKEFTEAIPKMKLLIRTFCKCH